MDKVNIETASLEKNKFDKLQENIFCSFLEQQLIYLICVYIDSFLPKYTYTICLYHSYKSTEFTSLVISNSLRTTFLIISQQWIVLQLFQFGTA